MPLDKVTQVAQTKPWHDEIPVYGQYTFGLAGERFFREMKDHARFVGTRCTACHLTYVPATMFCERCFSELDEWVEVPNQGTVFTYTVLHLDLDDGPLDPPAVLAYVKLDESDGGLVHYLGEVEPDHLSIGMEVEAVFKEAEEREGSILDIRYFRPVPD